MGTSIGTLDVGIEILDATGSKAYDNIVKNLAKIRQQASNIGVSDKLKADAMAFQSMLSGMEKDYNKFFSQIDAIKKRIDASPGTSLFNAAELKEAEMKLAEMRRKIESFRDLKTDIAVRAVFESSSRNSIANEFKNLKNSLSETMSFNVGSINKFDREYRKGLTKAMNDEADAADKLAQHERDLARAYDTVSQAMSRLKQSVGDRKMSTSEDLVYKTAERRLADLARLQPGTMDFVDKFSKITGFDFDQTVREMNRLSSANEKNATSQERLNKIAQKNAENYDVARERLNRYILSLERFERQLNEVRAKEGLSSSTRASIDSRLRSIGDRKAYAELMRDDYAATLSRTEWAQFLTQYRGDALAKNEVLRTARYEAGAYDRNVARSQAADAINANRRATQEQDRIERQQAESRSAAIKAQMEERLAAEKKQRSQMAKQREKDDNKYASILSTLTSRTEALKNKRAEANRQIEKGASLGINVDSQRRALEAINVQISEYNRLIKSAPKADVLGYNLKNDGYARLVGAFTRDMKSLSNSMGLTKGREVEAKADMKTLERQAQYLEDTVRKLNHAKEAASMKKYVDGVDTSRLKTSISDIEAYIETLKKMLETVRNGQKVDMSSVRGTRKDMLSELNLAQRAANQSQRELTRSSREAEKAKRADERAAKDLANEYNKLSRAAQGAGSSVQKMKDLVMQFAPVYGVQQLVMSVIEVGGEIEKQHIAMQSILGDLHNANDLFGQIKNLALESPFKFGELNKDVKQLAAYNVEYEDLYDTTKRLADISAGLGVSFERIALAYGQVKSRSWLDGKELRQFAYAGVPLLQNLADMYTKTQGQTVTTAQVKKMVSNRQVSFEDVQSVLWNMTDEGGKFFNMQSVLAETLYGRYNKLIDAWEIMLSGFAKGDNIIGGTFKKIIDFITQIVLGINTIAPALLAAFAPRFLKGMFGGGGMSLNKRILASKSALADSYMAKAAAGEKLSPREAEIVKNKKKITVDDARSLYLNKAINKEELKRLYINGSITREQYRQIAGQKVMWRGLLMMGNGIKGLANGITGLFGGPWMMALSAALAGITYLWQKQKEAEEAVKQVTDELLDRYKQLREFQSSRNVMQIIDTKDAKRINDAIDEYLEKIKELSPENYNGILMRSKEAETHEMRLKYLSDQVDLLIKANDLASSYADSFVRNTKGGFDDAREAIKQMNDEANKTSQTLNNYREGDFKRLEQNLKESGSRDLNNLGIRVGILRRKQEYDKLRQTVQNYAYTHTGTGGYLPVSQEFFDARENVKKAAEELKRKIESQYPDLGNSRESVYAYKQLRESMYTQLEYTPDQKSYMNVLLDSMLGLDTVDDIRSRVSELMVKALEGGNGAMRQIANKLRYLGYDALSPAEKAIVTKLMGDVKNDVINSFHGLSQDVQQVLNDNRLRWNVDMFINKPDKGSLEQELLGNSSIYNDTRIGGVPNADTANRNVSKAKQWLGSGNTSEVAAAIKKDVDAAKEDYEATKKNTKISTETINAKRAELTRLKDIADALGFSWAYADKPKKQKSETDKVADEWNRALRLLKEYEAEYSKFKKVKGEKGAVEYLADASHGDWKNLLAPLMKGDLNMFDPEAMIDTYFYKNVRGKAKTNKQKEAEKNWLKEVTGIDLKNVEKVYKVDLEDFKRSITEMNESMDIFDSLVAAGISKKEASELAMALNSPLNRLESLYGMLGKFTSEKDALKIIRKDDNELIADYGKNWEKVKELANDIYNLQKQIRKDAKATIAETMKSLSTVAAKVALIESERDEKLRKIREGANKKNGEPVYSDVENAAINAINAKAALQIFEASDEYMRLMEAPLTAGLKELDALRSQYIEKLTQAFNAGTMSAKEYKENIDKVNKVFSDTKNRSGVLATYLKDGVKGVVNRKTEEREQTRLRLLAKAQEERDKGNTYAADLYQKNADALDTANQKLADFSKSLDDVSNIVSFIDNITQGVKKGFDGINELVQSFGGDDLSNSVVGSSLNALSIFTSGASGILQSALNGDIGGVLGGVVTMFTDPLVALNRAHDARIEEEIRQRDEIINNQNWFYNTVSGYLSKSAAGVYSVKAAQKMNRLTGSIRGVNGNQTNMYAASREALSARLSGIRKNYKAYLGEKDTDPAKIDEYKQKIFETEEEVKELASTMASELYGVDLSSWANNLASALVNAWKQGTGAAKAYGDTVSDILMGVAQKVVEQKVFGTFLEDSLDEWYKMFDANNGEMTDELLADLTNRLRAGEGRVEQSLTFLDNVENALNRLGYTGKSRTSGLAASIAGVTEDTADLLGSYMNAIRLDVSMNRTNLAKLVEDQMPTIGNTLALCQAKMEAIRVNTAASAASAANIEGMISDVINGVKSFNIATH